MKKAGTQGLGGDVNFRFGGLTRAHGGREGSGVILVRWPGTSALRVAMRSVSYVQRVALDFSGSLFPHAICLGDADNDAVSACALQTTAFGRGEMWESGVLCACALESTWRAEGKILIDSVGPRSSLQAV